MNKKQLKKISLSLVLAMLAPLAAPLFPTRAANLDNAIMRLDRMTASQTGVRALVIIDPTSTATEDLLRVTFAAGFDVDTLTVSTTDIALEQVGGTHLTPLPGISTITPAAQVVDIPCSNLAPGTLYGVYISGIGTPAAGQYKTTITTRASSTDVDTAKVALRLITSDQVVITGTVPPTYNLTLSANTDNFTTDLDPASVVSTAGITLTSETNATNGWSVWLRSANTSLDSITTGEAVETAGSATDDTPEVINAAGTGEYYQLDVTSPTEGANGTSTVPTIAAEYDGDATHGGTFSTAYQELAYGNGTTDGDIVTLIARAVPTAIRAAATDYTDTWTIVGAANF